MLITNVLSNQVPKGFSHLSVTDFWLNSTVVPGQTLCGFCSLKFVEVCFWPRTRSVPWSVSVSTPCEPERNVFLLPLGEAAHACAPRTLMDGGVEAGGLRPSLRQAVTASGRQRPLLAVCPFVPHVVRCSVIGHIHVKGCYVLLEGRPVVIMLDPSLLLRTSFVLKLLCLKLIELLLLWVSNYVVCLSLSIYF